MALPDGAYAITSMLDSLKIGRSLAEDKSLLPKPVFAKRPDQEVQAPWTFEQGHNGQYTVRNAGGAVGDFEDRLKLFAYLMNEIEAGQWCIEPHAQAGKNHFVILRPSSDRAHRVCWTVPEEGEPRQIELRPLDPDYPPTQVFCIEPALDS